jgi:hypothetical protein
MPLRIARMISIAMVLGALAASTGATSPAKANGNPLTVTLSYLNGVSNWGPTNAAGVAELVGREGEVRLVASGLPQLRGERYALWLMDTARGDRMPLGTFGAGEDGVAKLDVVLDDVIPDKAWNLLMVSVEGESVQGTGPSARHSIAGRFSTAASAGRPGELPRTGGAAIAEAAPTVHHAGDIVTRSSALFLAGTLVLVTGAFAVGRWSIRRRPQ